MDTVTQEGRNINNFGDAYSKIIDPQDYNRIIGEEHLYIAAADKFIYDTILEKTQEQDNAEIVELGCGPGRLFPLITQIQNINLTAIDVDSDFIQYAKNITKSRPVNIINADIIDYQHQKPVNIFFSQGVHHHISKGKKTTQYLNNIYSGLKEGGYYILSDEFIADYKSESERTINIVIWYSHIIAHAMQAGYDYLAQEEAKTLLDDLHEGRATEGFKTEIQINLVLKKAAQINKAAVQGDIFAAKKTAQLLVEEMNAKRSASPCGNDAIDLFRGDYKICDKVFRDEIRSIGFVIESVKQFGLSSIGNMAVYLLKKI